MCAKCKKEYNDVVIFKQIKVGVVHIELLRIADPWTQAFYSYKYANRKITYETVINTNKLLNSLFILEYGGYYIRNNNIYQKSQKIGEIPSYDPINITDQFQFYIAINTKFICYSEKSQNFYLKFNSADLHKLIITVAMCINRLPKCIIPRPIKRQIFEHWLHS